MLKKHLMKEEGKYIGQYHTAIFKLMNENDITYVIFPLVNLINQVIENEIKSLIAEAHLDTKSFKINIPEFYKRWGSYSEGYRSLLDIYIAYSFSNNITYLKQSGKSEIEINCYKTEVVEKTYESLNEERIDKLAFNVNIINEYIEKFLIRNKNDGNKYVDFKYCE